MKSLPAVFLITVLLLSGAFLSHAQTTIPTSFFGMDINKSTSPWPTTKNVPFGVYRTLGSQIKWADLYDCTSQTYNFSKLNYWFGQAQTNGQLVMFTAYYTPSCLSSQPNDAVCAFGHANPPQKGGCDLPSDVLTTDQTWIDFINGLVTYANGNYPGVLKYLEIWNEPNVSTECNPPNNPNDPGGNCTAQALVQMTKDANSTAKAIDANIMIVSPAVTANQQTEQINPLFSTLLADGEANYADILGFHGYIGPPATNEFTLINSVFTAMQNNNVSKPIYDTEDSYGPEQLTDTDQQQAWVGSDYMIHASYWNQGLKGISWYGWDFLGSNFWDFTNNVLLPPGVAYQNVHLWLLGAHPVGNCFNPAGYSTSVWACNLTRTGGYQAQAVWDQSQTCSGGTCTFSNYTPPSGAVAWRDLNGGLHNISGGNVLIGLKPILIENQKK